MTRISSGEGSGGLGSLARDGGAADNSSSAANLMEQALRDAKPSGAKRKQDALEPDGRYDTNGRYADRGNELKRLRIVPNSETHQSEHVVPYNAAHPNEKRSDHAAEENAMPAYHETWDAHRKHAGTGSSKDTLSGEAAKNPAKVAEHDQKKADRLEKTGFTSAEAYRRDIGTVLGDPVAARDHSNLSNAYQLNQLGYNHQRTHDMMGKPALLDRQRADNSFQNMVSKDPTLEHSLRNAANGGVSDQLHGYGQAEAYASRLMGESGRSHLEPQEKLDMLKMFGVHPDDTYSGPTRG